MSTSHMKFLDWPETMQIISSKKIGVGLVLATVYQIVIRHEGTLGLKITLGERTSFTVFLPDLETSLSLASN